VCTLETKSTVAETVDKSSTKSTVDFVADTFDSVAGLSPVCRKSTVTGSIEVVDHVAKVEHVQLGRIRRKLVILSPECRASF